MRVFKSVAAALASTVCFAASPAISQETELKAPLLGFDAGFFLVPSMEVLDRVIELGISDLRDNVVWDIIEPERGKFNFEDERQSGVAALNLAGLAGSLIIWTNNPIYEDGEVAGKPDHKGGYTVTTRAGIRALARFVSAYLEEYPTVRSIEIGNEFNSGDFLYGPISEASAQEKAKLQVDYLKALDRFDNIREARVIGASAHSIASAYIWEMLDLGAAALMDAISIHTYTTEPEHIPGELAVLRRHPEMENMDIEITEFGQPIIQGVETYPPDFFWRNYCMMAQADVKRAVWYPLKQRGDSYPPVIEEDLSLSPLGQAVTYAQTQLQGNSVEVFHPDPYTYGCIFNGGTDAVLWGEPLGFSPLREDISLRRGDLREFDRDQELLPQRVVMLHSDGEPIDLNTDLAFCPQPIVADSYHQFYRPAEGENAREPDDIDGFRRYLLVGEEERIVDLKTCPGHERGGVPWRPYLCAVEEPFWQFSIQPAEFNFVGSPEDNVKVVFDYPSEKEQLIYVDTKVGEVAVDLIENPDVTIDILVDDTVKTSVVIDEATSDDTFGPFAVPEGSDVKVVFGSKVMPQLYLREMRVTLRNPTCDCNLGGACETPVEEVSSDTPEDAAQN